MKLISRFGASNVETDNRMPTDRRRTQRSRAMPTGVIAARVDDLGSRILYEVDVAPGCAGLPIIGPAEAAAPPPERSTPADAVYPRILIVDDNDDIRRLLRVQLERLGTCEVVDEACDGVEAIEKATIHLPSLVFLDVNMPRMDGLEALPHIVAAVPGVRVVMLSALDASSTAAKALEAGATMFVEKSLRVDFPATIATAMAGR